MNISDTLGKYKSSNSPLELQILDKDNVLIGRLQCINTDTLNNMEIISLLTKWRNKNASCFLSQFVATPLRTKNWMSNVVIPAHDRILFLVYDLEKNMIGNLGLCNVKKDSVEIDNVLRGEKTNTKDFFYYALCTVLRWAFTTLDILSANLHVFSNNTKAIKLYEKLGFTTTEIMNLSKMQFGEEVFYVISNEFHNLVDFKYCKMELQREKIM